MRQVNYAFILFLFFKSIASAEPLCSETHANCEELDEEFLDVLGSFEAEDDEWYDIFWSAIEELSSENNKPYVTENIQN